MRVQLLGTGAADGWPNAFCDCASCATLRARGEHHAQSAALVNDVLMLDCGPDVPTSAARLGVRLGDVRHVLLTHAHPDHTGPAALLWRSWARRTEPLEVYGPSDALDLCRDWIGPDDPVRLVPLEPGDRVQAGAYDVRALRAEHDGDSLLYDVTAPDGARLLYATDTGPLSAPTLRALAGRAYDVVLLEETFGERVEHDTQHLDLTTFAAALDALRAGGAVLDSSQVMAIHLGHHNPTDLAERLRPLGVLTGSDGAVLLTGDDAAGHRTLVLGGARSGKSSHAEALLAGAPEVVYVATGGEQPGDDEWAQRVTAHRARRPSRWRTVETLDLVPLLRSPGPPLLVDCFALWLTRILDEVDGWDDEAWREHGHRQLAERVDAVVQAYALSPRVVVGVSNEVGSGVVPEYASGRRFRDELGRLNAALAAVSDDVTLLVAGLPQQLRRGRPTRVRRH